MKNETVSSSFIIIILLILTQTLGTTGKNLTSRIFGGKDIDISQAKFVVQVISQHPNNIYGMCGGSLVTPFHIITAAHCVRFVRLSDITVIGGATYYHMGGVHRTVRRKHMPKNRAWDIAVLKLKTALIGSNIETIPLCNTQWKRGDLLSVYGWGFHSEKDVISFLVKRKLREVQLPVVDHAECALYFNSTGIPNYYFCAGIPDKKGSFNGDSGGPAVLNNRLCGVVSGGGLSPGIGFYVDINYVKNFIRRYIKVIYY